MIKVTIRWEDFNGNTSNETLMAGPEHFSDTRTPLEIATDYIRTILKCSGARLRSGRVIAINGYKIENCTE